PQLAGIPHRCLGRRGGDLLDLLLFHVALQPDARARVQPEPAALGVLMMAEDAAAEAGTPMIEMRHVHKWFGDFRVLTDINLEVRRGERVVVCGPSGSGK